MVNGSGRKPSGELRLACGKARLRVTPQRIAIYELLISTHKHPTADQVHRQLVGEFPHLSLDTVNRTLLKFAEIGLVGTVEGHGSPRRYDANLQTHHHAHCTRCGSIIDFKNAAFDQLEVPASIRRQFTITGMRVVLSGICQACSTDNEKA